MEFFLFLAILFYFFSIYLLKRKAKDKPKSKTTLLSQKEKDFLKAKGDLYEKFIGQYFEKKSELVIYNGFIYGYADKGVDLISICSSKRTINLIQCKDWSSKKMFLEDIEKIYKKLSLFDVKYITKDSRAIKKYLKIKKNLPIIEKILAQDKSKFKVKKLLYMSAFEVIDENAHTKITKIKSNIFTYKDMQIIIKKNDIIKK